MGGGHVVEKNGRRNVVEGRTRCGFPACKHLLKAPPLLVPLKKPSPWGTAQRLFPGDRSPDHTHAQVFMPALSSVLPWSSPSHMLCWSRSPTLQHPNCCQMEDRSIESRTVCKVQVPGLEEKVCALHVGASLIRPSGLIPYLALD